MRPEERRPAMLCRIHLWAQPAAQWNLLQVPEQELPAASLGCPPVAAAGGALIHQVQHLKAFLLSVLLFLFPKFSFCLSFCLWPEIRGHNFSLHMAWNQLIFSELYFLHITLIFFLKKIFSRCQTIPVAHYFSKFTSLLIHWAATLDQAHGSAAAASFSLAFNSTVSSSSGPSDTSPCWGSFPPLLDPYWQTDHSTCFFILHTVGSNTLPEEHPQTHVFNLHQIFPFCAFWGKPMYVNARWFILVTHGLSSPISAFLPTAACISFLSLLL